MYDSKQDMLIHKRSRQKGKRKANPLLQINPFSCLYPYSVSSSVDPGGTVVQKMA